MVKKSDNNDKQPVSVEAIYAHYQRSRPNTVSELESGADINAAKGSPMEEDATLADNLYKHYQASRASNAPGSIDAIMHSIDNQAIDRVVRQEEQPAVSQDAPKIQAIDVKPARVDEQAQIDRPAANKPSILKRWLMPGIAAAIVCVVLMPMLMNSGSNPDTLQATLPVALSDRAEQTVAYIDASETGAFGFSNTTNTAQLAFNSGVIATDLQLLVDAKQTTKTQQTLRSLVAAQSSSSNGLEKLAEQLKLSAVNMNDAIAAGENTETLREHLATINAALHGMAKETKQLDWYVAGRSVETIRVAAEYTLEYSDVKPLESALLLANKIEQPVTDAPASTLLPQLLQAELSGPEEFERAAEILNWANDIKLLMQ